MYFYIQMQKGHTHARTSLKILWSMSEPGGLRKRQNNPASTTSVKETSLRMLKLDTARK